MKQVFEFLRECEQNFILFYNIQMGVYHNLVNNHGRKKQHSCILTYAVVNWKKLKSAKSVCNMPMRGKFQDKLWKVLHTRFSYLLIYILQTETS